MMKNTPKVIFRTIAHNAEVTIARTIESVLAQTYDNWELHLVNNGSTDNTGNIMNQYCMKDHRIKVFTNDENYVWKEGNKLYDYYKKYDLDKTYTCCLDADDEYKPEFLNILVPFAEQNNLDIACCGFEYTDAMTGKILEIKKPDALSIMKSEEIALHFPKFHRFMRSRCMKLFRLTLTDKAVYNDNFYMVHGGDSVESMEYFRNAECVGFYPAALYIYYRYPDSVTFRWFDGRQDVAELHYNIFSEYLNHKAGKISRDNYEHLMGVYLTSIISSTENLLGTQIPAMQKLKALHSIFTSGRMRELASISFKYDAKRLEFFMVAVNWITSNERNFDQEASAIMISEILSTVSMIPGM